MLVAGGNATAAPERALDARPTGRVVVADFFTGRRERAVVVNPVVRRDVERGGDAVKMIEAMIHRASTEFLVGGRVLFVFHAEMPLADHRRFVAGLFQDGRQGGAIRLEQRATAKLHAKRIPAGH